MSAPAGSQPAAAQPAAAQPAPGKPVPVPTPETQPFWDGCAAGELRLQRCTDCSMPYFYPRPVCPACGSTRVEWFTASGRASLHSYVINHRPARGFENDAPYAIAVVQLAEGPRMMTNLTGVPNTPDDLVLDMPLRVVFEQRGDMSLPVFTPAEPVVAPAEESR
ncbi:MAG TPA: Zn-ribbon domain-containing OB-fold protein [Streptosporangiaceae bacterium]|nr:Zn-ribbon domain-containing OB-fold protein [Streptosporangiaceae bacterium]